MLPVATFHLTSDHFDLKSPLMVPMGVFPLPSGANKQGLCPLYVTAPFKYVMTAGLAPLLAQQQLLGSSHLYPAHLARSWYST